MSSLAWLWPALAHADDGATACLSSHEAGQTLRAKGQLRAARDSLLDCADASCPDVLRQDCTAWIAELETTMPSVVISARDAAGADLSAVEIYCDGERYASSVDGKGLTMDPGPHQLRFVRRDRQPPEERILDVVLREGEKLRPLDVVFPGAEPPPPPPPVSLETHRPAPPLTFVFGGLGVIGLGVAAVSFASARADEAELDDSGCAPRCNTSTSESIDRSDTVAVVAGGIGVAAFVTATVLYVTRPTVTVTPTSDGASITVLGRF